jgi:replicative DNA helicase
VNNSKIKTRGSYRTNFTYKLWDIIRKKCNEKNIPLGDMLADICEPVKYFCKSRGKYRIKKYNIRFTSGIPQDLLLKIGQFLKDNFLISLANGDIIFDEITSIQNTGKHKCYDLTVPKTHNFIANDIVVHNTGFMFNLAYRIAKFNEDACVLFMSIDDSRQQAIPRLVATASGLQIRQITHPSEYIKSEEDQKKMEAGWQEIMGFIEHGRFAIKDVSHGTDLNFAENWIRWTQEKYPDKQVLFFLDNFHKLSDDRYKDERVRFKHASGRIHAMKNRLHISAICTMETRKFLGTSNLKRPMLADIAESKQMEFDNNMIGMIYNDLHARRDSADAVWIEEINGENVKKPIVEIDIQKNKITDFKGTLYYKMSPEHSMFYECSKPEVDELRSHYKAAMKNYMDKKFPQKPKNEFLSASEVDPW